MLPPQALLESVVCVAARGYVDVQGPCCHQGPYWSLHCDFNWAQYGCPCHVDVYGWYYHWRQSRFLRSVRPPESMLMSMICAATEGHDGVCGLSCGRGSYWCPWSMLPQKVVGISMIYAPTKKPQIRDPEGFCVNHSHLSHPPLPTKRETV